MSATTSSSSSYFPVNITLPMDYSIMYPPETTTATMLASSHSASVNSANNNTTTAASIQRRSQLLTLEAVNSAQWPVFVNACLLLGGVVFKNEELGQCVRRSDFENFVYEGIKPSLGYIFLVLAHLFVFIVGIIGNAMVCVAIWRNRAMRTVTNHYIVNLAVADFLVLIVCLPPTVLWDVLQSWLFGNIMCKAVLYAQFVCVSVSILTLTVISIDRWLAIVRPLKFRSNSKKARLAIAMVWFVSCLVNIPCLFVYQASENPQIIGNPTPFLDICSPLENWSFMANTIFDISIIILCYFIPLVIMTIAYIWMARVLWSESGDGGGGSMSSLHHIEHADSLSGSENGVEGSDGSGGADGFILPVNHPAAVEYSSLNIHDRGSLYPYRRNSTRKDIVGNGVVDHRHLNGSIDSPTGTNQLRRSITPLGRSRVDSTDSTFYNPESNRPSWRQWASNSSTHSTNSALQLRDSPVVETQNKSSAKRKTSKPKSFSVRGKKSQFITLYNNNLPQEQPRPDGHNPALLPAVGGARIKRLAFANDSKRRDSGIEPLHRPLRRLSTPMCLSPTEGSHAQKNGHLGNESPPPSTSPFPNEQLLQPVANGDVRTDDDDSGITSSLTWWARKLGLAVKNSNSSNTSSGLGPSAATTTTTQPVSTIAEQQLAEKNDETADSPNSNGGKFLLQNLPQFSIQVHPNFPSPSSPTPTPPLPPGPGPVQPLLKQVKRRASAAAVIDERRGSGRRSLINHGRLFGRRLSSATNAHGTTMTTVPLPLLHSGISRGRTLSSAHEHTWKARNKSRRNAAKMLIAVAALFAICFFPVHFLTLLRDLFDLPDNTFWGIFSLLSHWLCYAQSATNPIIYNIMNKHFRREFRRLLFGCFRQRRTIQSKESAKSTNRTSMPFTANGTNGMPLITRGVTRHGSAPQPGTTPLLPASTWRQQQQRAAANNDDSRVGDRKNNEGRGETEKISDAPRSGTSTSLRVHNHPQLASSFSVVREKPNDESNEEEYSNSDANNNRDSVSPASTMLKSEL